MDKNSEITYKFTAFSAKIDSDSQIEIVLDPKFKDTFVQPLKDKLYLKSLLGGVLPIYDAYPVIAVTEDKESPFHYYTVAWFAEKITYVDSLAPDELERVVNFLQHLYYYNITSDDCADILADGIKMLQDSIIPERLNSGQLFCRAPTDEFHVMKVVVGELENCLHFYNKYSIVFVRSTDMSYDFFNEFIHDLDIIDESETTQEDGVVKDETVANTDEETEAEAGDDAFIDFDSDTDAEAALLKNKMMNFNKCGIFTLSDLFDQIKDIWLEPAPFVRGLRLENFNFPDLEKVRLLVRPNNRNERNSMGALFRSKKLANSFRKIFTYAGFRDNKYAGFGENDLAVNDVFKYNVYDNSDKREEVSKFDWHYDTMFTSLRQNLHSLYSVLLYTELEGEHRFFSESEENSFVLQTNVLYFVPHFLKHKVEGKGRRAFIKTELTETIDTNVWVQDEKLTKIFDYNCFLLRHSVQFPQLRSECSKSFNLLNEARYFQKMITNRADDFVGILVEKQESDWTNYEFSFFVTSKYFYFKTSVDPAINREQIAFCILEETFPNLTFSFDSDMRNSYCSYQSAKVKIDKHGQTKKKLIVSMQRENLINYLAEQLKELPKTPIRRYYRCDKLNTDELNANVDQMYFAACEHEELTRKFYNHLSGDFTITKLDKKIVRVNAFSFQNGIKLKNQ